MQQIELEGERAEHPLDTMEQLALRNGWPFERDIDDEITLGVSGTWSEYQIQVSWMQQLEALHTACSFELRVAEPRRTEILKLIALANERMWIGHFDYWPNENIIVFRHAMLLSGGAPLNRRQIEVLIKLAVEACDLHYQAFQFVVWGGKSAREALDAAIVETVGEA
jgi:hypothetical protein